MLSFQSKNVGDIEGAFLEASPLKVRFRPLHATQPKGGIPGLAESDVIEEATFMAFMGYTTPRSVGGRHLKKKNDG